MLKEMDVDRPEVFLKKTFSDKGVCLESTFVSQATIQQIDAEISEAIASRSIVNLTQSAVSGFPIMDINALVNLCPSFTSEEEVREDGKKKKDEVDREMEGEGREKDGGGGRLRTSGEREKEGKGRKGRERERGIRRKRKWEEDEKREGGRGKKGMSGKGRGRLRERRRGMEEDRKGN